MLALRTLVFILGTWLVVVTISSAIKTLVLPRAAPNTIAGTVFRITRWLFNLRIKNIAGYSGRDRIMAYYAPVSMVALLPTWLALILLGYAGMYWALGAGSWYKAFLISGSALLTLNYTTVDQLFFTVLEFSEATIGLMLVALLIAYLPSIYAAFSRREAAVSRLEVRAGNPPSAVEMIARYHRIHGLDQLKDEWVEWERWFTELQESHTSFAALVFFRSSQPQHSWVTAAVAVLDSAALASSALDIPPEPRADLCIRSGYLALRAIANFFNIPYYPDPHYPNQPVSLTHAEFEAALDRLAAEGIPLVADRKQAWQNFAGWRVNYDSLLKPLADLIMSPAAPWIGEGAPD